MLTREQSLPSERLRKPSFKQHQFKGTLRGELGFGRERERSRQKEHRRNTGLGPGCAWHLQGISKSSVVKTCSGTWGEGKVGPCLGRFEHWNRDSELILEVKGGQTIGSKGIMKLRGPGIPLKLHLFLCSCVVCIVNRKMCPGERGKMA